MKLGDKVLINKTKQIGTIVGMDKTRNIVYLKVHHPSGPKIISVLDDAVTIIQLVKGIIPLILKIWEMIFQKKKKKKRVIILNDDLKLD